MQTVSIMLGGKPLTLPTCQRLTRSKVMKTEGEHPAESSWHTPGAPAHTPGVPTGHGTPVPPGVTCLKLRALPRRAGLPALGSGRGPRGQLPLTAFCPSAFPGPPFQLIPTAAQHIHTKPKLFPWPTRLGPMPLPSLTPVSCLPSRGPPSPSCTPCLLLRDLYELFSPCPPSLRDLNALSAHPNSHFWKRRSCIICIM